MPRRYTIPKRRPKRRHKKKSNKRKYEELEPNETPDINERFIIRLNTLLNQHAIYLGEKIGIPPQEAIYLLHYYMVTIVNVLQQRGIRYDEYYSLHEDELARVLAGAGIKANKSKKNKKR